MGEKNKDYTDNGVDEGNDHPSQNTDDCQNDRFGDGPTYFADPANQHANEKQPAKDQQPAEDQKLGKTDDNQYSANQ